MNDRIRRLLPKAFLLAGFAASLAAAGTNEPDELERTVAMMARIGSATSPSFSPDGKALAFVSNLGGIPQVWTVDAAGGYPQLVTTFDDPLQLLTECEEVRPARRFVDEQELWDC